MFDSILYLVFCMALICFSIYIWSQLTLGMSDSVSYLEGKTAIVTGGNAGIGYQISLMLASRGCRVIIADIDDASITVKNIIQETDNSNIIYKYINLASLESVRTFAEEIHKTESKIDILINNAGTALSKSAHTTDGLNFLMQVNYFGPFLLTHLLIDLLKKSKSGARVVFTSSILAFLHNLKVEGLNPIEEGQGNLWNTTILYANSKMATIIASDIFAEKLKQYNIISNSLNPGTVRTNIVYSVKPILPSLPGVMFLMLLGRYLTGKTPYEGAQTAFHLATSKKINGTTGKFFQDCKVLFKPPMAYRQKDCQKIWDLTETLVKLNSSEKIR